MPRITHQQFDTVTHGLAVTHEALSGFAFKPSILTNGEIDDRVLYGSEDSLTSPWLDLKGGIDGAQQILRRDVWRWGLLALDQDVRLDEVDIDKRLEVAGILAMMTAPEGEEKFNEVALTLYKLFENVIQGNRVVVVHEGLHEFFGGEPGDDIQESGQNNGKITVTFEHRNDGDAVERGKDTISIWSDRPYRKDYDIVQDEQDSSYTWARVVFPLLQVNLKWLATNKAIVSYPDEEVAELDARIDEMEARLS